MKPIFLILLSALLTQGFSQPGTKARNIFIITIDGLRWQEVFTGADAAIMDNPAQCHETGFIKQMFWDEDTLARRQKLMPFLWNVLSKAGQLYGNRLWDNKMNVKNIYKISYPGYNEIFTGYADLHLIPNTPVYNSNTNILEYLNQQEDYKGKVAAFTSWDKFHFILNEERSGFTVNCGYEETAKVDTASMANSINKIQTNISDQSHTRHDELTFLAAKEYILAEHPKVMFLGLGETDEFAHQKDYAQYLRAANNADRIIADLWYLVQSDSAYRNNTTFIITTDHGRGKKPNSWQWHGIFTQGSGEVWMAMMGAGIQNSGEIKTNNQIFQRQIAATIATLLGQTFKASHPIGKAIPILQTSNADLVHIAP